MEARLMRAYVEFLRRPYAARLLSGTLLGRLPNGMGALAIVIFTRAHGGGYPLAGALAAVYALSTAAGQPVLGRAMDRLGQPKVLLASALTAAAGFAVFAAMGLRPTAVAVAAVAVTGAATPPLEAGLRALWPAVLPGPAEVQTAYALDAAAQEILFTCGPLLVVAATAASPAAGVLLCGALGIAGTLVVISSHPSRAWRGEPRASDWAGPLRSPGLRLLLAALACVGVALGVLSVAVVAYAEDRHLPAVSGVLLAAMSFGALTGGVVYGTRPWPGTPHGRLQVLVAALAAGYLPLALVPGPVLMTLLTFASGVFLAPVLACSFTLVDRLAPRGTVTEAFAWVVAAFGAGASLGSAVAGLGEEVAGVPGAFAGAGAGGACALAVCVLGRGRLRPAEAAHADSDPDTDTDRETDSKTLTYQGEDGREVVSRTSDPGPEPHP